MNLPRQGFAANFRILTRHDYLQSHFHQIGVKDTPDCPFLSGEAMDFKHLTVHLNFCLMTTMFQRLLCIGLHGGKWPLQLIPCRNKNKIKIFNCFTLGQNLSSHI